MGRVEIDGLEFTLTFPGTIADGSGTPSGGGQESSCGDGPPTIELTSVPALGSTADLTGRVSGVSRTDYRLIAYICVQSTWYAKPFEANPLTAILPDCTFSIDITTSGMDDPSTGGMDELATAIRVFVVPSGYPAQLNTLPAPSDFIASATRFRGASECAP